MALGFRAGGATASGGISQSVSQPVSAAVRVGDLCLWAVSAEENTRGWGNGIDNIGAVPGFFDLSTAAIASVWNGRSQYLQDDGVNPRHWLWLGWKIATAADTGGATWSATLRSAPAFGLGVASAYVVYGAPAAVAPIFSLNASAQGNGGNGGAWVSPSTGTPSGGSTGTFLFTVGSTTASWRAAQTTVAVGNIGDAHVVALAYGEGGVGVWIPPASLVPRVTWGGLGGPWYMLTWADAAIAGAGFGRLPLLGAG